MTALHRATQNRTAIGIAHRLSTVVNADNIYVLSDGRVVESGNHFNLVSKSDSLYANLWAKQHQIDRELQTKQMHENVLN
jgi:ABC-type transport system involved in Fe-S cluster assembly fused permease/ATPase subunit